MSEFLPSILPCPHVPCKNKPLTDPENKLVFACTTRKWFTKECENHAGSVRQCMHNATQGMSGEVAKQCRPYGLSIWYVPIGLTHTVITEWNIIMRANIVLIWHKLKMAESNIYEHYLAPNWCVSLGKLCIWSVSEVCTHHVLSTSNESQTVERVPQALETALSSHQGRQAHTSGLVVQRHPTEVRFFFLPVFPLGFLKGTKKKKKTRKICSSAFSG